MFRVRVGPTAAEAPSVVVFPRGGHRTEGTRAGGVARATGIQRRAATAAAREVDIVRRDYTRTSRVCRRTVAIAPARRSTRTRLVRSDVP